MNIIQSVYAYKKELPEIFPAARHMSMAVLLLSPWQLLICYIGGVCVISLTLSFSVTQNIDALELRRRWKMCDVSPPFTPLPH